MHRAKFYREEQAEVVGSIIRLACALDSCIQVSAGDLHEHEQFVPGWPALLWDGKLQSEVAGLHSASAPGVDDEAFPVPSMQLKPYRIWARNNRK